jgi:exopolysaccharide/PEP-CTERM locus tyrosine autokinase
VGKFFDALQKAKASQGRRTVAESKPSKVVKISKQDIEGLKLDTSVRERIPVEAPSVSDGKIDPRLISLANPQSPIAEKFKLLRARIFCSKTACRGKAIMVTSAQSFDGKSVVATNLAITIAQGMDEYVLLVDCDLRKPSVHHLFGLDGVAGVREYLETGTSVAPFLQKTSVNKLSLLPAGQPPHNPAELLSSDKMAKMIEEVRDRYPDRYVIFDTTPAGFAAETNFLSNMADGVLLTIRSGKTSKKLVMEAIEHIGRDKILGIVFNADQEDASKYNYYYRYYKGARGK